MKRNKLVSIAAITVALGVLATGCAGGSGSSKSDSKSSGGTKTVTVKAGTGANVKPYTYVGDDNETSLCISGDHLLDHYDHRRAGNQTD